MTKDEQIEELLDWVDDDGETVAKVKQLIAEDPIKYLKETPMPNYIGVNWLGRPFTKPKQSIKKGA